MYPVNLTALPSTVRLRALNGVSVAPTTTAADGCVSFARCAEDRFFGGVIAYGKLGTGAVHDVSQIAQFIVIGAFDAVYFKDLVNAVDIDGFLYEDGVHRFRFGRALDHRPAPADFDDRRRAGRVLGGFSCHDVSSGFVEAEGHLSVIVGHIARSDEIHVDGRAGERSHIVFEGLEIETFVDSREGDLAANGDLFVCHVEHRAPVMREGGEVGIAVDKELIAVLQYRRPAGGLVLVIQEQAAAVAGVYRPHTAPTYTKPPESKELHALPYRKHRRAARSLYR